MNSFNNEVAVPNSQPTTTEGEIKMEKVTTLLEVSHDPCIHDYQLAAYVVNGFHNERYDAEFTERQSKPIALVDITNKTDEHNALVARIAQLTEANDYQRERLSEAYLQQSNLTDVFQMFIDKVADRACTDEDAVIWNMLTTLFDKGMLNRPFYEERELRYDVVTTQRVTVNVKVPKSYDDDELYDLFSERIQNAADNGELDYVDDDDTDDVKVIDISVDDCDIEVNTIN